MPGARRSGMGERADTQMRVLDPRGSWDERRSLHYRTEGREPTSGYCQRCKEGVYVPERELRRCPTCARDICAACRVYEKQIEAYVCLDCARVRRYAKGALARSLRYLLLLAASAGAILLGRWVALRTGWVPVWFVAAVVCGAGVVTFAWELGFHHPCPFCEGRARVRRRKRRFREYECKVCKQVWME